MCKTQNRSRHRVESKKYVVNDWVLHLEKVKSDGMQVSKTESTVHATTCEKWWMVVCLESKAFIGRRDGNSNP